jgi:hypothetical protein
MIRSACACVGRFGSSPLTREEECPTWNPIATIIRHDGSMPGFGERRKALRFSALPLLRLPNYCSCNFIPPKAKNFPRKLFDL